MIAPLSFAEGAGSECLEAASEGCCDHVAARTRSRSTRSVARPALIARRCASSRWPWPRRAWGTVQIPPWPPARLACRSNSPTPATGSWGPLAACRALPAHARSACEPHREWIEAQVRLGRNATAIYQELVDRLGFSATLQQREALLSGAAQRESRSSSTAWNSCLENNGKLSIILRPGSRA